MMGRVKRGEGKEHSVQATTDFSKAKKINILLAKPNTRSQSNRAVFQLLKTKLKKTHK